MRIAQIRKMDISNGEGIGVSLFTQFCPFHCPGCHNMSTWAANGGEEYTQETKEKILELVKQPHISRFSILGGEPLLPQNVTPLADLVKEIKETRPNIKIWLWTGTDFETLLDYYCNDYHYGEREEDDKEFVALGWTKANIGHLSGLLEDVDYLIDGRFIQEKKDLTLEWRGSSNQRVLNCRASIKRGEPVLADM